MLPKFLVRIHKLMRRQKLNLFFQLTGDLSNDTMLDVGGGSGIIGEFNSLHIAFRFSCVANLDREAIIPPTASLIVADGCCLPLASGSFDWVFSNAVIEHVGDWERQKQFAEEVRRVHRKGFFVATPNRKFPLEPHTLLPFFQFLPKAIQKVGGKLSLRKLYNDPSEIRMLDAKELSTLFPEAHIHHLGTPVIANTLVAVFIRPSVPTKSPR